ncbi:unnamed protein product [Porites lobata]|uniref:Endonuclease/exonuclease/phosphatase domain-containing protein n=1 Tax=Porites lobata TaxID=104759 RepID=A0ABN8MS28_9CNID|nr:unnamed protein product [Porites lobata]
MLVDIQINTATILRENKTIRSEMTDLKRTIQHQTDDITALKSSLEHITKQYNEVERGLVAARKKIQEQEEEIGELYDLQDKLEQYTRKNSIEIHGVPECAYTETEDVVLKLAEALDVSVEPKDIEICHKLNRKGNKPIIVKFISHKVKTNLYRARAKLKNVRVSNIFPHDKAGRIVLITWVLNSLKLSLVNIYAPNSQSEQLDFLQNLNNCLIDKSEISTLIVGGDWNCTLSKIDKIGGTIWKPTNYRNLILTTMDAFDLVDIQRLRHPRLRKYSYDSKC